MSEADTTTTEEMPEYLLTPEQLRAKQAMADKQAKASAAALDAAEKEAKTAADLGKQYAKQKPSADVLRKLGLAQARLAKVTKQRAAFDAVHPEYTQGRSAASEKKKGGASSTPLVIGGVLAVGVLGYFAYRKWVR